MVSFLPEQLSIQLVRLPQHLPAVSPSHMALPALIRRAHVFFRHASVIYPPTELPQLLPHLSGAFALRLPNDAAGLRQLELRLQKPHALPDRQDARFLLAQLQPDTGAVLPDACGAFLQIPDVLADEIVYSLDGDSSKEWNINGEKMTLGVSKK